MEHYNFDGAQVYSKKGTHIGEVLSLSGEADEAQLEVRMVDSDRVVMLPYIFLDAERSDAERLYLTASEDDELQPYMTGDDAGTLHFEVAEEHLIPHVREVMQGHYVIEKTVDEVRERQDIELGTDTVTVDRIDRGDILDSPPQSRREGDVLIVPVIEEVLVVEKRYRVIEEVRVTLTRETRTETVEDTLRKERVTVTEELADGRKSEL